MKYREERRWKRKQSEFERRGMIPGGKGKKAGMMSSHVNYREGEKEEEEEGEWKACTREQQKGSEC